MQTVGQAWLVLELTGSGTALGLVVALQFLPVLLFAPWGGVLADRFSKRKLLFITQTSAGTLALILATLVLTNTVTLWMVYVLASLLGIVNAVDNPTRQSFAFEMVGADNVRNAVTLNSTEVNLARIIGPAIAGIIIATIGIAFCFFLNAVSYGATLICLFLMRASELHLEKPLERVKGQLMQGFRYVWHTPLLRNTLIMMGIVGTFTFEFQVSLALMAKYTFAGDAHAYALLMSSMGIGAVIGGLATAGRKRIVPQDLVWISIGFGIAMMLASLAPSLTLGAAAMVIVGVCSLWFQSLGNSLLQLESVPNMRSRVMSLWSVAFMGSTPIGGPIIGWIGEYVNPRWGLAVGGMAALAAGLFGMIAMKNYLSSKPAKNMLA